MEAGRGPAQQRFELGYHLISWDLGGRPYEEAYPVLQAQGVHRVESLLGNSLGVDTARRYMPLPDLGTPPALSDTDALSRIAMLGRAADHGLTLGSIFVNATFVDRRLWPRELEVFEAAMVLLKGFGGTMLVCGGGPPERIAPHDDGLYRAFAEALADVGRRAAQRGLDVTFHPHLDFFLETGEQIDRALEYIDTDLVGLCLDPAHLFGAGSDPVAVLRRHGSNVRHVHLKDYRGDPSKIHGWKRYEAFSVLGEGDIDLEAFVRTLIEQSYDGTVVIELDLSSEPDVDCTRNLRFATETLGLSFTPPQTPPRI